MPAVGSQKTSLDRPRNILHLTTTTLSYFLLRIATTRLILKTSSTLSTSKLLVKVEESMLRNIFLMNVNNYTPLQENTLGITITNMFGINLDRCTCVRTTVDLLCK
ncbi:hypothetical protein EVAR_100110_1 [Eumeta japonica]|uniref:Uncharacterized protein n=1 Tax=Eumeta variegata TaxID=151549 RepID=A0A4C1YXL3_EUMVA|nr:hypothetical protein EVAR_100110_1 [Eumeta japonica]